MVWLEQLKTLSNQQLGFVCAPSVKEFMAVTKVLQR
jgi:hypothetical protein